MARKIKRYKMKKICQAETISFDQIKKILTLPDKDCIDNKVAVDNDGAYSGADLQNYRDFIQHMICSDEVEGGMVE